MTTAIRRWLDAARRACDMQVRQIPWSASREWLFDGQRLRHRSGAFFSIVGTAVHRQGQRQARLDQPLIDQPEVGLLGFLARTSEAPPRILVQAKPEPGNVGVVQAAPTVQATESNYTRRHGGKPTLLLEHFLAQEAGRVHADSLQSEQGTRFLGKYNRNMLVEAPDDHSLPASPGLAWFPVAELLSLLAEDFQVNTDARSVLASAPWHLLAGGPPFGRWRGRGGTGEAFLRSFEAAQGQSTLGTAEIAGRLARLRAAADFAVSLVGLPELAGWEISDAGVVPTARQAFEVRHFAVESTEREVPAWDQPLVASPVEGQALLLCQERGGVLHFLFAARPEVGFRERVQYGPTLVEAGGETPLDPPGVGEAALRQALGRADTLLASRHSDEGGRFYRCVARYAVLRLPPDEPVNAGEAFAWMTLHQVHDLIRRPGFFSNEARTLVSLMLAYL